MEPQNTDQNSTIDQNNQQTMLPRILLIGFFVLFVVIILALVFKNRKSSMVSEKNTSEITQTPVVPTIVAKEGFISLKTSDAAARYAKDATISVEIMADSNGLAVTGYDLLVNFDSDKMALVAVASLSSDFKIYKLSRSGGVTLTGTKLLTIKTPTVFANTKIAIATFRTKAKGVATVGVVTAAGKEVTQFVDANSKKHRPQTNQISLEIY